MKTTRTCHGNPPTEPSCDATGTTAASAERHTRDTGHCTDERVVKK